VEYEVVQKRGSFYYYGEDLRIAQGRENAKIYLKENPDIQLEIETIIRSLVLGQDEVEDVEEEPTEE
jgi:recombination protein RecA